MEPISLQNILVTSKQSAHTPQAHSSVVPQPTNKFKVAPDNYYQFTPSNDSNYQFDPESHGGQEKLYANRAELKLLTARIAMHLTEKQRSDLFKQIDELLDHENWTVDDSLIAAPSYRTLLRFLVYAKGVRRPSLTVSSQGFVSSSWVGEGRRLTIEFLPRDHIRLVLRRRHNLFNEPELEAFAYEGSISRLDAVLAPFDAVNWYRNVDQ